MESDSQGADAGAGLLPFECLSHLLQCLDAREIAVLRRTARFCESVRKELLLAEAGMEVLDMLQDVSFPFTHAAYVLGLNGPYFSHDTDAKGHHGIPEALPRKLCRLFRLSFPGVPFTTVRLQRLAALGNFGGRHRTLAFCLDTAPADSSDSETSESSDSWKASAGNSNSDGSLLPASTGTGDLELEADSRGAYAEEEEKEEEDEEEQVKKRRKGSEAGPDVASGQETEMEMEVESSGGFYGEKAPRSASPPAASEEEAESRGFALFLAAPPTLATTTTTTTTTKPIRHTSLPRNPACEGGRGDVCEDICRSAWRRLGAPGREVRWASFPRSSWLQWHWPTAGAFFAITVTCEPLAHRRKLTLVERNLLLEMGFALPAPVAGEVPDPKVADTMTETSTASRASGSSSSSSSSSSSTSSTSSSARLGGPARPAARRSYAAVQAARWLLGFEVEEVLEPQMVEKAFRSAVRRAHPDRRQADSSLAPSNGGGEHEDGSTQEGRGGREEREERGGGPEEGGEEGRGGGGGGGGGGGLSLEARTSSWATSQLLWARKVLREVIQHGDEPTTENRVPGQQEPSASAAAAEAPEAPAPLLMLGE